MNFSKKMLAAIVTIGLLFSNISALKSFSKTQPQPQIKVAMVDVQKLIEHSPKINTLKNDMKKQLVDLDTFIKNARVAVSKEPNKAKKKALEDKYNKELNTKKNAIDTNYSKKLHEIDQEITTQIKTKARNLNYNLVLTKNTVLDGATDITDEIIKELK